jgi:Flp pilus assembly protein TadD
MILAAAIAAAVSAAQPVPLSEAAQALEAGRLDQARIMVAKAMASGAAGPQVDLILADLAFADGKDAEALARYEKLVQAGAGGHAAERGGISALRLGLIDRAVPLIAAATENPKAGWRAWNARAVLADLAGDFTTADTAYERAALLAPDRVEVVSNRGWSKLLRGDWQGAVIELERAVALRPSNPRTANNLELARAALAADLPRRRSGESGQDWARRLNDVGVAAQALGQRTKAIAAFTQALDASGTWYARAANNLAAATAAR